MRHALAATALALALCLAAQAAAERVYPRFEGLDTNVYLTVTPKPRQERYETACYAVKKAALIAMGQADDPRVIPFFINEVKDRHGLAVAVNPKDGLADYDLVIRTGVKMLNPTEARAPRPIGTSHPEGYSLRVCKAGDRVEAHVIGNTLKGVQHGLQSLRQLMVRWKDKVIVREAKLLDWPTIKFRFVKRLGGYWLDNVVRWKMNGGTRPMHPRWDTKPEVAKKSIDGAVRQARERSLYLLGMVGMRNLYEGRDEAIARRVAWYVAMHKAGFTHLAVMNDDRMTLADPVARERFGTYYATQVETVSRIHKALRAAGYRERLGYMPNHYYGKHLDKGWLRASRGKLHEGTSLFWCGLRTPGPEVTRTHLTSIRKQAGLAHLWFYTNWPQCATPSVCDSFGPARRRDFGTGDLVELVTVSTTTYPRSFPTSFITMCDLLWNPEDYHPDRALLRATKEVVDPESFPAFYKLFKYIDAIAPISEKANNSPMYLSDNPNARRTIITSRSAMLDKLVTPCLATAAGKTPRARKVLENLLNTREKCMERLAAHEAIAEQGVTPRRIVCPVVSKAPILDGNLDDAIWKKAAIADRFTDLRAKKAAPHQTTVRVLRHKDKLYFAIRCDETHLKDKAFMQVGFDYPLAINTEPGGFLWWAEEIELFLDPGRDRAKVFQTMLNPWGLKQCITYDTIKWGYFRIENQVNVNYPVVGKTDILEDAWVLEFAIPISAFGVTNLEGEWGFNVARTRRLRPGKGMKYSTWTPLGWGFQDASTFGIVTFAE